jgi:hypothetical protein
MLNWLGSLKCPDCGGRITEQEKYCPHCGADLDAPVQKSQEDALEYFERARKTYDRNGSMRDALLDCELALQYNPEFAGAHNLHGLILDALEKPQKAIKAYRRALELDPNLEDARANIMDFEAEHKTFGSHQSPPELNPHPDEIKSDLLGAETGLDHESAIYVNEQARGNSTARTQQTKKFILAAVATSVVLLSIACTFWFVSNFIGTYFGPKSTVVFEADHSLASPVKRADLEATAAILTERCQQLGYKNISFHVSDQNEIIGEVPTALNPQKIADEIKTIGLLEFVDFGDEPQNTGLVIRTDLNDKYFPTTLEPRFHTIMSNEGIETAVVTEGQIPKSYVILFVLTDEGSGIFTKFTSSHRGTFLGIVLDTIVISAPMINEPITGGEGVISGNFTEEEAVHLAAILQTKPLPIPIKVKQIINN